MWSPPRVVIDKKYIIEKESKSFFINKVILLFTANKRNFATLRLPCGLETYWEKIKKLHNSETRILTNRSEWIYNTKIVDESVAVQAISESSNRFIYYEVFDRDLCIAFIDHHTYRYTLAVCIEMFLRRQLKEYSDHFDLNGCHIRSVLRYRNLHFALPQLCITSNNPDDIRKLHVIVDKKEIRKVTATEEETFNWWTCDDETLPKFRCRPALLNSMDCMQLLFDSSEHASNDLIAKVAYHLRPFRFVLPFTFLFDIFGGTQKDNIIEKNFPSQKCRGFSDSLVLMDEHEKTFADNGFSLGTDSCSNQEIVKIQRQATAFLGGGFLAYLLGLTNDYDGIDIYIKFHYRSFQWFLFALDNTMPGTLLDRSIWIQHPIYIPTAVTPANYRGKNKLWDGSAIFRNLKQALVKIHSVFKLNESHQIVKHWKLKYGVKNLPYIIFYETSLHLDNYTILKLISGFDLPICRNALAFDHAWTFHLREFILEKCYGHANIAKSEAVRIFIGQWKNDELNEIHRILAKVSEMSKKIVPKIRAKMYLDERQSMFTDKIKMDKFLKQRRQMNLIRFPFDSVPVFDAAVECNGACPSLCRSDRIKKYKERVTDSFTDYHGNKALPLQVYPLKYLSYWKVMELKGNNMYNCLCNLF